jgi:predicted nuclease with TOPRIM domain
MNDIYESNAPESFPTPNEQPVVKEEAEEKHVFANPSIEETVKRWRKEVIDKIQYMKENLEQTNQEKEALSQEVDNLQAALAESQERIQALEKALAEALETFNGLLNEVSKALEG